MGGPPRWGHQDRQQRDEAHAWRLLDGNMRDSLIRVSYLRCGGKLRSSADPFPCWARRQAFPIGKLSTEAKKP